MDETLVGFALLAVGAICGGSWGLPSKFAPKDTPWEVLWGPFFFFVTILIPTVVAPLVVGTGDLGRIYSSVCGSTVIVPTLIFGLLWGLGSMTLGMSFAFIGLSLAYSLNYGAQIIFGSVMPLTMFDAHHIPTAHGAVILSGVAVCLIGVIVAGRAAMLKERSLKQAEPSAEADPPTGTSKSPRMLIGVIIAVLSGVLCACYAVALAFAKPINDLAGASVNPWAAAWPMTAMILWGGAVSACLYCVVQLTRNKTWKHFSAPGVGRILWLAGAMAVLHDVTLYFFGMALHHLGDLGVPVGYPAFMAIAILVGNFHGFRTGEWKGASKQSIGWIAVSIVILIAGVFILAKGNAMFKLAKAAMTPS